MAKRNFFEWYNYEATEAEKALVDKVSEFEHLFEDMLFRPESITGKYVTYTTVDGEYYEEYPEELDYFSCLDTEKYSFKVRRIKGGCSGQYNRRTKTLYVAPESLNDNSVILHEMIHLYEHYINTLFFPFHDAYILAIYKDLSTKISDIDDRIIDHMNIINQGNIRSSGGEHDLLFYLKSLSLDIAMNYPLNTVMGYGYLKEGDADDLS